MWTRPNSRARASEKRNHNNRRIKTVAYKPIRYQSVIGVNGPFIGLSILKIWMPIFRGTSPNNYYRESVGGKVSSPVASIVSGETPASRIRFIQVFSHGILEKSMSHWWKICHVYHGHCIDMFIRSFGLTSTGVLYFAMQCRLWPNCSF